MFGVVTGRVQNRCKRRDYLKILVFSLEFNMSSQSVTYLLFFSQTTQR